MRINETHIFKLFVAVDDVTYPDDPGKQELFSVIEENMNCGAILVLFFEYNDSIRENYQIYFHFTEFKERYQHFLSG
jgi:hypothetical protein